jgi:hypothetical protein
MLSWFPDDSATDNFERMGPGEKEELIEFLSKIVNNVGGMGRIEWMNADKDGIHLHTSYDDYCRGCHMGTIERDYNMPWEILLGDRSVESWRKEQDELFNKEEARKKEEERLLTIARREAEERATFERLKQKFGKPA